MNEQTGAALSGITKDMSLQEIGEVIYELNRHQYEEKPVDITTFVNDPYFLGTLWSSEEDESGFYPFWMKKLQDIHPSPFFMPYNETILHLPIGAGKSLGSLTSICYMIYLLLCLKDPQAYYGIRPSGTQIVFTLFSASRSLAEEDDWGRLASMVENGPWFRERGIKPVARSLKQDPTAIFAKGVGVTIGSSSVHALGKAVFGGCFPAETPIYVEGHGRFMPISEVVRRVNSGERLYTRSHSPALLSTEEDAYPVTPIIKGYNNGYKPCYEVQLSNGTVFRASSDQLMLLPDGTYKRVDELEAGDTLSGPLHLANDGIIMEDNLFDFSSRNLREYGGFPLPPPPVHLGGQSPQIPPYKGNRFGPFLSLSYLGEQQDKEEEQNPIPPDTINKQGRGDSYSSEQGNKDIPSSFSRVPLEENNKEHRGDSYSSEQGSPRGDYSIPNQGNPYSSPSNKNQRGFYSSPKTHSIYHRDHRINFGGLDPVVRGKKFLGLLEVYDLLVGHQIHNFEVPGVGWAHNCLDEANFHNTKNTKAKEAYLAVSRRMESRFMQVGGSIPGMLFLASSPKFSTSFLSERINNAGKSHKTYVVSNTPIWEIKHHLGLYSGKTFPVFSGDEFNDPLILTDEQAKTRDPATVIQVPVEYRDSFEKDLLESMRDIVGASITGAQVFFRSRNPIAMASTIPHRFTRDVIQLDFAGDRTEILKYADTDYFRNPIHPECWRFIHVDLSKSRDRTGIAAIYCVPERMDFVDTDGRAVQRTERFYFVDWAVMIQAKLNEEIPHYKIEDFLIWLKRNDYPIKLVSFDTYQSATTMQNLRLQGFEVRSTSVDSSRDAYVGLRSAIHGQSLLLTRNNMLMEELVNLQDDGKKIDHLPHLSKDGADAVAGAFYNCQQSDVILRGSLLGKGKVDPRDATRYQGVEKLFKEQALKKAGGMILPSFLSESQRD